MRHVEPGEQSAMVQVSGMTEWENLEYAVIARDRLDDLAALARDGDVKAQRLQQAITEWDVEAPCINCKVRPLPQPTAFVLVLKDDGTTWGCGICERCGTDESKIRKVAREHLRRAYPTMRIVEPGTA